MSRITGSEAKFLMEAYNAVYNSQELTEEQIWEEVETWVNSLLEEGYDLSDYTWEDMYEAYIEEQDRGTVPSSLGARRGAALVRSLKPQIGSLPPSARQVTQYPQGVSTGVGGGNAAASVQRPARPVVSTPAASLRPGATPPPAASTRLLARPTATPVRPSAPSAPAAPMRPSAPAAPVSQRPSLAQQRLDIEAMRKKSQQRIMAQGGTPATPLVQSFDPFDIVMGYLIDEGCADTNEEAYAIMVNLSEEQKNKIIDFVKNSFLNEEEARQGSLFTRSGKPQDFRNPKKISFTATDPTPTPASRRLPASAQEGPKSSPGQLNIPEPKTTKVSGVQIRKPEEVRQPSLITKSGGAQDFTKAGKGRVPFTSSEPVKPIKRLPSGSPKTPKSSPGQMEIDFNVKPNKGGSTVRDITDTTSKQKGLSPSKSSKGKPPTGVKPTKTGGLRKIGGKLIAPAAAALDAADEYSAQRARGRQKGSAVTMGATKAAGGWAGAKAGAKTGAALGSFLGPKGAAVGAAVGGIGGYLAGSEVAGRASETIAGATGKEKAAMAKANRQSQAGSAIKGIGGKTTFSQKKPGGPAFMSTGVGKQRKTVELAKTGVVQRGAQSTAGHLAFKGGKAVYKAGPSAQSLAKTSSNPLERVGRSLFAGAYKKHDAAKAQQALAKARQSDVARNKKLGVKMKPGG